MATPARTPYLPPLLAAVLALAAAATAQQADRALPALRASEFAGVMAHDGALLGVARSYRATFFERGVEFLPALGERAPRASPWNVRFESLQRDVAALRAADCPAPERESDRRSVTYHWPGVDERYEARPAGLKHSFVLQQAPQGGGDLCVHLHVDTALEPARGELAWRDERGGGVTLGEVVGIDANGTRVAGSARHVDGGVELRLPAWFVDAAAYPLELDPLISTAQDALPGADCDFPDIAYDDYTDSYCVVWTQFFGGGATGAVAAVFTATPMALAYAFAVNQTGNEDSVRVTNIAGTGLYVLVWVNRSSAGSSISGMAFEPSQAIATNVFTLWGPVAYAESPVLSGEATIYDDDCLVAWLDGTYGLIGCSLAIDTQLQPSATPLVQIAGGNATEPAFSKQGGNPGLHVITWIDRPVGLPGWVRAQVVDHDMNVLGPGAWIRNAPQNCGFPAVDGDGFRFVVAWEEQEVANPSATDVRGRVITIGTGGITSQGNVIDLATSPGGLEFAADVAMLGDRFGLVWETAAAGGGFTDDVWFKTLATTGLPIGGALRLDVTPGTSYGYEHAPRLIGRRAGNPNTPADDGIAVFADQSATTGDSNVGVQAVESMGAGGPILDLGGGCGPGGIASTPGPFALGHPAFPMELYGAEALAVPFVFVGLPAPRIQCGVCSVIQSVLCWFVPNQAGTALTSMQAPADTASLGLVIEFQFVTLNVNYVGCPPVPGIAASNIVSATLDY
jgi:hypothetical protein